MLLISLIILYTQYQYYTPIIEQFLYTTGVPGPFIAFLLAVALVAFIVALIVHLYLGACIYIVGKRYNVPYAWLAFIPIGNVWIIIQTAKLHWAWIFIIFVGIVPILGSLAQLAGGIFIFYKYLERLKQPWWWILVVFLLPIIGALVAFSYFAFALKAPKKKK